MNEAFSTIASVGLALTCSLHVQAFRLVFRLLARVMMSRLVAAITHFAIRLLSGTMVQRLIISPRVPSSRPLEPRSARQSRWRRVRAASPASPQIGGASSYATVDNEPSGHHSDHPSRYGCLETSPIEGFTSRDARSSLFAFIGLIRNGRFPKTLIIITGNGFVQAPVTERPVVLPPERLREQK
jgi:hypothetical protein